MTTEQAIATIGAVTALVGAITALVIELRALRKELNGRLTQLIGVAAASAHKEGELVGRDWAGHPVRIAPVPLETPAEDIPPSEPA
jgi:hypothetical protein